MCPLQMTSQTSISIGPDQKKICITEYSVTNMRFLSETKIDKALGLVVGELLARFPLNTDLLAILQSFAQLRCISIDSSIALSPLSRRAPCVHQAPLRRIYLCLFFSPFLLFSGPICISVLFFFLFSTVRPLPESGEAMALLVRPWPMPVPSR